jgi:hypothetical protein
MDIYPMDESIDVDSETFIVLSYDRTWPKYVVTWSVRRRAGESDFPVETGSVGDLPPRQGTLEDLWDRLRQEALAQAQNAVGVTDTAPVGGTATRGFLSRLFGR